MRTDLEPGRTNRENAGEDLRRIVAFLRDSARRQAAVVVDVACGFAALDPRYAASYDNNKLVLTSPIDGEGALRVTEEVFTRAELDHRYVVVDDDTLGTTLAEHFTRAGYEHDTLLVMRHVGPPPAPPGVAVSEASTAELREADHRDWVATLPDAPPSVLDQLVDRRTTRLLAAETVAFLTVRDSGRIAARADFYAQPTSSVAQIEELVTDPPHRGRGFARALLTDALRRAARAGCPTVFLIADSADWPRHLYARCGFTEIGRTHVFRRGPSAGGTS